MHEPEAATAEHGSVVLDIGEDTGAFVLYVPPGRFGLEVEVSRVDEPQQFVHTVVRSWTVGGKAVFAAVFSALPAGVYSVWRTRTEAAGRVVVPRGGVVEMDWPE